MRPFKFWELITGVLIFSVFVKVSPLLNLSQIGLSLLLYVKLPTLTYLKRRQRRSLQLGSSRSQLQKTEDEEVSDIKKE